MLSTGVQFCTPLDDPTGQRCASRSQLGQRSQKVVYRRTVLYATGRPNRPAPSKPKPTLAEVPKGCLAANGFVRHWTTQPASAEPAEANLGRGPKMLSSGVRLCTALEDPTGQRRASRSQLG